MRVAGIDPGSVTGVVVLETNDPPTMQRARWRAAEVFRPSTRQGWTEVDRDGDLAERITLFLAQWDVDVIALEESAEAKGIRYRGYTKQKTETAFRSGCYYQLALQAAHQWRRSRDYAGESVKPRVTIASYPAVDSKTRGAGWMGRSPRTCIVQRIRQLSLAVQAPEETRKVDKYGELVLHHLGDALGVLVHHLSNHRPLKVATA